MSVIDRISALTDEQINNMDAETKLQVLQMRKELGEMYLYLNHQSFLHLNYISSIVTLQGLNTDVHTLNVLRTTPPQRRVQEGYGGKAVGGKMESAVNGGMGNYVVDERNKATIPLSRSAGKGQSNVTRQSSGHSYERDKARRLT